MHKVDTISAAAMANGKRRIWLSSIQCGHEVEAVIAVEFAAVEFAAVEFASVEFAILLPTGCALERAGVAVMQARPCVSWP